MGGNIPGTSVPVRLPNLKLGKPWRGNGWKDKALYCNALNKLKSSSGVFLQASTVLSAFLRKTVVFQPNPQNAVARLVRHDCILLT